VKYLLLSSSLLVVIPTSSLGAECNFQRPVGVCTENIPDGKNEKTVTFGAANEAEIDSFSAR